MTKKRHYILIDDSALDLFINEKMLSVNGMSETVQKFNDAQLALNSILETPSSDECSIVLLDLQMPGMNGFEFIEKYKHLEERVKAKYKIFMLSSTVDAQDIKTAQSEPLILSMLTKPLNPTELQRLLDEYDA